jgi:hypothetical protein
MKKHHFTSGSVNASTYAVIDGVPYPQLDMIMGIAKSKGYTGSENTLAYRIKGGAKSWAELIRSPRNNMKNAMVDRQLKREREKAEIAQMMRDLDERKR